MALNKRKIINDPVYGFINIPGDLFFDLIEHPYFQRLRRIKQLGLTHLVYPGALHTRFHHAIGATHIMGQAIQILRVKGHSISPTEEEGALTAILLHDIGHGPFSHALEHSLVKEMNHESLSLLFMKRLNTELSGRLEEGIAIFTNTHPKPFLHQLVSSQLDMDRIDYLRRDSFYTGVAEGVISSDRIINMLNIAGGQLVVEEKGIYSIEKFIIARRLMYWQVYFHKTVLAAEQMLIRILKRARELCVGGEKLFATPALAYFLNNDAGPMDFNENPDILDIFSELDDFDIFTSIKVWKKHPDRVLSLLSRFLVDRRLFKIEINDNPEPTSGMPYDWAEILDISEEEIPYFVFSGEIANNAYDQQTDRIYILRKDGSLHDISTETAELNIAVLSGIRTRYFHCSPKPEYFIH